LINSTKHQNQIKFVLWEWEGRQTCLRRQEGEPELACSDVSQLADCLAPKTFGVLSFWSSKKEKKKLRNIIWNLTLSKTSETPDFIQNSSF